MRYFLIGCLLPLLLAGCGGLSLGGNSGNAWRSNEQTSVQEIPVAELEQQEKHRIAPLDELEVVVWDVPEFESNTQSLSQTGVHQAGYRYQVHADGSIELPLLGEVVVGGLTTEEAKKHIAGGMARFVKDPNVSVTITQYNSRKILILGEIVRPGIVQNPGPDLSLAEALAQAGGMDLTTANTKHVYIIRGGLDKPKVAHVSLNTAIGMFEAQHIWLKSRDIVFVDSKMITDWNRFISQLVPTAAVGVMLKSVGVIK